jgi:primosomal protein N' (replication factor Y) (superfamily II helicase)
MTDTFAEVILPLPLHDRYTYRIPESLAGMVKPGMRVIVQFGARKSYSAIVTDISDTAPPDLHIKTLTALMDDTPLIHTVNIELWKWISDYYMCPMGEVMKAALPPALKLESTARVVSNPAPVSRPLQPDEEALLNIAGKKVMPIKELEQKMGDRFSLRMLKTLISENILMLEEGIDEKYRVKSRTLVSINPFYLQPGEMDNLLEKLKRSSAQISLINHVLRMMVSYPDKERLTVPKEKLLKGTGFSSATYRQLTGKGILTEIRETVSRLDTPATLQGDLNILNLAQQEAISEVREKFTTHRVVLLHGITASGKTEIYTHLIDEEFRKGNQVLYLVPEIALTPQIVARLKRIFGNKVVVYHSKMSDAERVEVWNGILGTVPGHDAPFRIVLGTRSAIFLPFSKLGLIIVDEEHENSYKQHDPAPRYHARDMAVILGHQHKAPVLLGSATPSFESYLNAKSGKYGLVRLLQRHGPAKLPAVITADVQQAYRRRQMKSVLTPQLHEQITRALENKEQIVLFQNRRGYSPYVECMECGWIPWCINCDVSLTFHRKQSRLACHYCGYHISIPERCSKCNAADIKTRGAGTEKIENEISSLFPEARIARMDLDTTRAKHAFEKIIHKLESHKTDILIGTQMITKGLDIHNISLVGIINADNLLNFPDFRAHERAFQLIHQVSGRSGRKEKEGTVVIQTSQTGHPVIQFLLNNDYEGFFRESISERKTFFYPPWYRLIKIVVRHKSQEQLDKAALQLASLLRKSRQCRVLGPEYPLISRLQLWYNKEIWLKFSRDIQHNDIKNLIRKSLEEVKLQGHQGSTLFQIDVDPM